MPKLSICYIVKNEIEHLPASINRMRQLADEIVVVDTGSSDGTAGYAKDIADVFDKIKWNNDFSMARNRALDLATSNWILMLDADEWIEERYFADIYKFILQEVDGYSLQVFNFIQNPFWIKKPVIFYGEAVRLFRNYDNILYQGIIHEKLIGLEKINAIKVPIYHFQYYEADKINKKVKMYLKLMDEKIKNEGRTFLNIVHLADVYRRKFIWTNDVKALNKLVNLLDEALRIKPDKNIQQIYNYYKKLKEAA